MEEQIAMTALRIRDMREIRNITTADMARMLGIAEAQYLRYEAGEVDFAFSFLMRVSEILGVSVTALVTGEEPKLHRRSIVRGFEGLPFQRNKNYDYKHLAYNFADRKLEPFIVTVQSAPDGSHEFSSHDTEEFMLILEGSLQLILGDSEIILNKNDTILFDSTVPHSLYAYNSPQVKFLTVIVK